MTKKQDNKKNEWWIFTFGASQRHAGHYVKIKGSFCEARKKMFDKYGANWAFQYSNDEWESIKNDPNRHYPIEKELEVIE